ncbi:MAG: hypothetical protein ABR553_01795 [Gammaproteobacteria bacterium]
MEQPPHNRTKPTEHTFDTRPDRVEAWTRDLPLANPGECCRRIYQALAETNTLDIPTEQRLRMLELLGTPVANVDIALKRHFVGQPFPLTEKALRVVTLSQALMTQMALGYRIVVEESHDAQGRLHAKRQSLTATHRALSYLGQTLLYAYQVYTPYPSDVWQQLHGLYQLAEAAGIHQTVVQDTTGKPCPGSVEDAYKRILLLALACPYRLRPGEAELIYRWLCDWAPHATLSQITENRDQNSLFVTNLASDDPPTYLVLRDTQYSQDSCRQLNAARLADAMRDSLGQTHNAVGTPEHAINEHVLRRLMLAWGVMPKRRFSRSQKHANTTVAMGLSSVHYFISGEIAFDEGQTGDKPGSVFSGPARFEASDTHDQKAQLPDLWELGGIRPLHETHPHARGGQYIEFSPPEAAAPAQVPRAPVQKPANTPLYQVHEWKMINVSAGGYRLLWDSSENSQAQVGELLGLRESNETDTFHLSLGVVRWMKHTAELGLELGVEMLSPGAVAVGTRVHKAAAGDYLRSLLLPAIKTIGQPATLLTPALPYRVGDVVTVNSHGKEARVELTKLMENTGTFAQYQFRPLDSQSIGNTPRKDTPEDFSELWKQL